MPIRRAVAGDAAGIASCVTQMYTYLRARNAFDEGIADWTAATTRAFAQAGYDAFVYANTAAGGRIDAVCIYGVENHDRGAGPEPWMAIKILAVRALTLTEAIHELNTARALKLAVPDAVARLGAIGLTAEYTKGWTKLHDYLATWSTATFEDQGATERAWARFNPGLPEFTSRMAGVN